MAKILIVADQTILREALKNLINAQDDMEVAGTALDVADAPALCRTLKPELILMNAVTKNDSIVIAYTAQIRREFPDIKIVIMTAWPEINIAEAASKAGAHSFIGTYRGNEYLYYVIRNTLKGYSIYSGKAE